MVTLGAVLLCNPGISDVEFFIKNSNHNGYSIKRRLFKYKEKYCESCGLSDWLDQKISLEVDHIDGDKFNNELTNLRILCPNCHAQTSSYRGRSKKRYAGVVERYTQST